MAEEIAEESAERVNAKRLAAKERKTAQLDENPPGQREICLFNLKDCNSQFD